jgi:hypothetical protein
MRSRRHGSSTEPSLSSHLDKNVRHSPEGLLRTAVDRHPAAAGEPVEQGIWQEALNAVSSGRATAGVTAEVAEFYAWPSLAFVPITDAPVCRWALVWRTANDSPLTRGFAQAFADAADPATQ